MHHNYCHSANHESEHDRLVRRKRELKRDMSKARDDFTLAASQYRLMSKSLDEVIAEEAA